MRRLLVIVPLAGVLAIGAVLAVKSAPSTTEAARGDAAAKTVSSPQLPIGQAVLFSSGVGYFQREGEIDGSARVDLSFPVQDINDLLKSMVLQDLGGGHISAVSYESRDPIDKTLRSFAINLTQNPGYGQILNQARGEKVEVSLQASSNAQPASATGKFGDDGALAATSVFAPSAGAWVAGQAASATATAAIPTTGTTNIVRRMVEVLRKGAVRVSLI
jgi:hypothetical protein